MRTLHTTTRSHCLTAVVATLAAALAFPSEGVTQARLEPVRVIARAAEASALAAQAESLYSTPRKWRKAASLHLRAAELRPIGDGSAVRDLSMAAHLYRAAGAEGRARAAMERAADQAAKRGDIFTAATAYVDAGFLALEARREDKVPALARKAELLAKSPLLTSEQRARIMSRVGYTQVVATIQR